MSELFTGSTSMEEYYDNEVRVAAQGVRDREIIASRNKDPRICSLCDRPIDDHDDSIGEVYKCPKYRQRKMVPRKSSYKNIAV